MVCALCGKQLRYFPFRGKLRYPQSSPKWLSLVRRRGLRAGQGHGLRPQRQHMSVFKTLKARRCPVRATGAPVRVRANTSTVLPDRSKSIGRVPYIRRSVSIANMISTRNAKPTMMEGRDSPALRTISPRPLRGIKCPWRAALLLRGAPGLSRYAESSHASDEGGSNRVPMRQWGAVLYQ